MPSKQPTYDASQIQVLEGLRPVRQSPGMFIGGTDLKGLRHLVQEVVDNAVDEHMGGFCSRIDLTLHPDDSVTVTDNGRGIPVDEVVSQKKSALEVVMTVLHAGGKFGGGGYHVSGGLHGVGVSVVNALSAKLEAKVVRDGYEWEQFYTRGLPDAPVKRGKKTSKSVSGTTIHFWPDPEIFPKIAFDLDHILVRMREIAFLNPGLTIVVTEESSGQNETLSFKGGLIEYVNFLNDGKDLLFPRKPVLFEGKVGEIEIAIAFQFSDQNDATEMSFANTINTVEGGNHLSGFRAGMTREINSWAKDCGALKEKDGNLDGKDVREGITAIISVRLTRPQFEGQTKTKLGNPEVEAAVSQFTQDAMHGFLQANAAVGKAIVERALTSKRARAAAKAAAEGIRRKGAFGGHRMPDKLRDCRSTNAEECEMFIVEGRSASGPALEARDSRTQAVFAIRGVILNVEKSRLDQALGNAEVQGIITAVGAGFSGADENGVDLSGLRYGKIIILTDADPDGGHIQTLLMTLFFRFMRPVIEGGHLYIAQPPLFKLEAGKKKFFALDEAELADLQKKHGSGRVTRFKGLGEQSAAELGETAIRPETRRIFRVAIDNVGEADREFVSLMGKDAEPRKVFLLKHGGERFEGAFR